MTTENNDTTSIEASISTVDRAIEMARAKKLAKEANAQVDDSTTKSQESIAAKAERAANKLAREQEREERKAAREARKSEKEAIKVEKEQNKAAKLAERDAKRAERESKRSEREANHSQKFASKPELDAAVQKVAEALVDIPVSEIYAVVSAAKKLIRDSESPSESAFAVGEVVTITNWNNKLNGTQGTVVESRRTRAIVQLANKQVYLPFANISKLVTDSDAQVS